MNTDEIRQKGESELARSQRFFKDLSKFSDAQIDAQAAASDKSVFSRTDCTQCANCCKTSGPLLVQEDINRLSQHLDISGGDFILKYLEMDEDGDFVFKKMPCPFLQSDDLCSIYEIRPKACREYPHTDRKDFRHLEEVHLKNSLVCPAVQDILGEMLSKIESDNFG